MKTLPAFLVAFFLASASAQTISNPPDRLVRGSSKVVLSTDNTDSTLKWSPGKLNFNDPAPKTIFQLTPTGITEGAWINGHLLVGPANGQIWEQPQFAEILYLSDKLSLHPDLTGGIRIMPSIDGDLLGRTLTNGLYGASFNALTDSTDGDTDSERAGNSAMAPDDENLIQGANYGSETFPVGALWNSPYTPFAVNLLIRQAGSTGSLTAKLYATDGAGKPTGAAIGYTAATDISGVTTDPAGEVFEIIFGVGALAPRLVASTQYAIVLSCTGDGIYWLSGSGDPYFSGLGWISADSGATWTAAGMSGDSDFIFGIRGKQGVQFALRGHRVSYSGSLGFTSALLGRASELVLFDGDANLSVNAGSPAWTEIIGFRSGVLNVTNATPARGYGFKISAPSATLAWGINTSGDIQANSITKLIFGGTATTKGVNYMARGATNEIIMGFTALTNSHYKWSATAFAPDFTIRTQNLGTTTTKGWNSLFLQDTAASKTLQLKTTTSGTAADTVLTLDPAGASRTLKVSGNSTVNQDVSTSGSPTFANILSGTYTPTLTNVANLDASTAYSCQYQRVGTVVTVSCKVDVDPTTTLTATQLGISLPIASALTAEEQCAGSASASGIAGQSAAIHADAANDRAEMIWNAVDVTNQPMFLTFTYRIL